MRWPTIDSFSFWLGFFVAGAIVGLIYRFRGALAQVRELLPAKVSRAVERLDRAITRRAEKKHVPLPPARERVRRARSFGLSQMWMRRVRREVVSIIEARRLAPGVINEQHLQNYATKVWRVLIRTRKKSGSKRSELLAEVIRPFLVKDGPDPGHLEGLLKWWEIRFGGISRKSPSSQLHCTPSVKRLNMSSRFGSATTFKRSARVSKFTGEAGGEK